MEKTISIQVQELPEAEQGVLRFAACFAGEFREGLLTELFALDARRIRQILDHAVEKGWLSMTNSNPVSGRTFRFASLNDQEAIYKMLSPEERTETHYRLANHFFREMDDENPSELAIRAHYHYSRSQELLQSDRDRQRFVRVACIAARGALKWENHQQASEYLQAPASLLPAQPSLAWRPHWMNFQHLAYQLAGLRQDAASMARLEKDILAQSRTKLEQAAFHRSRARMHARMAQWQAVLQASRSGLSVLGYPFPKALSPQQLEKEFQHLRAQLRSHPPAEWDKWQSEEAVLTGELWYDAWKSLSMTAAQEIPAFGFQILKTTLERGLNAYGLTGLLQYCIYQAMSGKHPQSAVEALRAAVRTTERYGFRNPVLSMAQGTLALLQGHSSETATYLGKAFTTAADQNDAAVTAQILPGLALSKFQEGKPLHLFDDWLRRSLDNIKEKGIPRAYQALLSIRHHVLVLRGLPLPELQTTKDGAGSGSAIPETAAVGDPFLDHNLQLQQAVLFRDVQKAGQLLAHEPETLPTANHLFEQRAHRLWKALALADEAQSKTGTERRKKVQAVREILAEISEESTADAGPALQCASAVIRGTYARLQGNEKQAIRELKAAHELARTAENLPLAGLIGEILAEILAQAGIHPESDAILQSAYDDFQHWGAMAKARQMEARYQLRLQVAPAKPPAQQPPAPEIQSSGGTAGPGLFMEIAAAITAPASLEALGRVALELGALHAQAIAGCFLVREEAEWKLLAVLPDGAEKAEYARDASLADHAPALMLNEMADGKSPLALDHPVRHPKFASDRYLIGRQPASMLCLPLRKGEQVLGVLVLEGPIAGWAQDSLAQGLAELIAGQTALAMDNVRRFEAREEQLRRRTSELKETQEFLRNTREQLRQSETLASLGQVTAGIAHEIRNPLNFVNNFSELSIELAQEMLEELKGMQDQTLDRERMGILEELLGDLSGNAEKIQHHGKRAESIVQNMLLHAAHGDSGSSAVDLNQLIREYALLAYHGIRGQLAEFVCRLDFDLDEAIGEISLRQQDISRALLNIFQNAFQAMEEKTQVQDYQPVLEIQSQRAGDNIRIRIRDNGPGMPEEVRARIFEPFFTTKPTGKGTGLGLSLSHELIVQGNGGSLEVRSAPGEFTEFIISIPSVE